VLRAVAYTDDCPPGGGGFTLWPGSHAGIWPQVWADVQQASRRAAATPAAQRQQEWDADRARKVWNPQREVWEVSVGPGRIVVSEIEAPNMLAIPI
jgi:hypothetical protein